MTGRRTVLRHWMALLFAVAGLVGSIVFAITPVRQQNLVFGFRPADSIGAAGDGTAVAPLAIARETPDRLVVVLPCEVEFPVSTFRSYQPGIWLSTDGALRSTLIYPDLGDGASFVVTSTDAAVWIGDDLALRASLEFGEGCTATATYTDGTWRLQTPSESVETPGRGPRVVEAAFEGPAVSHEATSVRVETRELGSSPGQLRLALFVAALAAAVLGLIVALRRDPEPGDAPRFGEERFDRWDAAFVVLVGLWAILGPAGFDDGWVRAIQTGYDRYGDFSGVFENGAATAPIGYWLNWVQHLWVGVSTNSVFLRIPAALLAVGTWRVGRWVLQAFGRSTAPARLVLFSATMVGTAAWGMTLRVEPVMALLLVLSLGCAVRLRLAPAWWVVPTWAIVVALGLTAHTSGLVVLAPVLTGLRSLADWARARPLAVSGAVAASSAAFVALLLMVDTNLTLAREGIGWARSGGHDLSALDELSRYALLDNAPYGSVVRRVAMSLLLGALVAFIVRLSRRRTMLVPGASLVVAVGLLALTPSKWPWHFGSLIGLVAVTLAVEVVDLSSARSRLDRLGAVLFGAILGGAWWVSTSWNALDLRSLSWWGGLGRWGLLGALIVAGVATLLGVRPHLLPRAITASAAGAVLLTATVLVADAVVSPGWTYAGQTVRSLVGRGECGLGDEVMVPAPASARALSAASGFSPEADRYASDAGFSTGGRFTPDGYVRAGINDRLPVAGAAYWGSYVDDELGTDPQRNVGGWRSGWYAIDSRTDSVGVMVLGSIAGNRLALQWATDAGSQPPSIEELTFDRYRLDWTLLTRSVPDGATRVRVMAVDASGDDAESWIALSIPIGLTTVSLAQIGESHRTNTLVSAALGPYFPCLPTPEFTDTVVRSPSVLVEMWPVPWQTVFAAAAASDRYFLVDVVLDPAARAAQIGAHLGDPEHFVFVSQEYLTGAPARANGEFVLVGSG